MHGVKPLPGVVFEILNRIGRPELTSAGPCMAFCSHKLRGIVMMLWQGAMFNYCKKWSMHGLFPQLCLMESSVGLCAG